jgi:hypothetical protein
MRLGRILAFFPVFLFASLLCADYAVVFNLNIGSWNVGNITYTNRGKDFKTVIYIWTFMNFKQTLKTAVKDDGYPVSEFTLNNNGGKVSSNWTYFEAQGVRLQEYTAGKIKERFLTNSNPALNIVCLLNFFLHNTLDTSKDVVFLNYDKFFTLRTKDLPDGNTKAWDLGGNYEILVERAVKDERLLPSKVRITKYKFLGINWNIFNLSLKEYTPL